MCSEIAMERKHAKKPIMSCNDSNEFYAMVVKNMGIIFENILCQWTHWGGKKKGFEIGPCD
jgi:hypothetical protein